MSSMTFLIEWVLQNFSIIVKTDTVSDVTDVRLASVTSEKFVKTCSLKIN